MLQFDLSSASRVVGSGESYPSSLSSNPSSSSYSASYGDDARSGCGDKCCACAGTCPLARSSFNTCFAIGDNLEYSFTLVVGCGDIDARRGDIDARRVAISAKYCGDGGPRPNDGDGGFLGDPIDVIDRHLSFKSTFDRMESVDAYFPSRLIAAQLPTPCSATPALSARVSASLHTLYNFRLFFLFCTANARTNDARLRQSPSSSRARIHACGAPVSRARVVNAFNAITRPRFDSPTPRPDPYTSPDTAIDARTSVFTVPGTVPMSTNPSRVVFMPALTVFFAIAPRRSSVVVGRRRELPTRPTECMRAPRVPRVRESRVPESRARA